MEIDEIVDYATNSPENTNPAVLRSMLSQLNSGSDVMWVTLTVNHDTDTYSVDKTNAEILNAVNSGKMVFCKDGSGGDRIITIFSLAYSDSTLASFSTTQYGDGNGFSTQINIQNDVVS